jgi:RNA polymerase sigma factor (sigma-70 family)
MNWHEIIKTDYPLACRVIRRLMPDSLRASHDAEDFVNLAITSLIRRPVEYRGAATLIAFARLQMFDAFRRRANRHQPLGAEPESSGPTADQTIIAGELAEWILNRARTPEERELLRLGCQGFTLQEISDRTDIHLRKVQRFFQRFTAQYDPSPYRRPDRDRSRPPDPAGSDPGDTGG